MSPYYFDALASVATGCGLFANDTSLPWYNATNVVSVATIWWARALYMIKGSDAVYGTYAPNYLLPDEIIISTRGSLRAHVLLYLVLIIQPVIICAGFATTVWLHKVPIGPGVGHTAILAGLDVSTAGLVKGAALSGNLRAPLRLEVTVMSDKLESDEIGSGQSTLSDTGAVRYRLTQGDLSTVKSKLRTKVLYG
jgi:hypothetical protein